MNNLNLEAERFAGAVDVARWFYYHGPRFINLPKDCELDKSEIWDGETARDCAIEWAKGKQSK